MIESFHIDPTIIFELTEDHIKLLRSAYVTWCYEEWGAPQIDPKRPYGDSSIARDVAEILGWELEGEEDGEPALSDRQHTRALELHEQTEVALQIVLRTGSFEPGLHEASKYGQDWHKVTE